MTGIEPASPAWEAGVLPMNYICAVSQTGFTAVCSFETFYIISLSLFSVNSLFHKNTAKIQPAVRPSSQYYKRQPGETSGCPFFYPALFSILPFFLQNPDQTLKVLTVSCRDPTLSRTSLVSSAISALA